VLLIVPFCFFWIPFKLHRGNLLTINSDKWQVKRPGILVRRLGVKSFGVVAQTNHLPFDRRSSWACRRRTAAQDRLVGVWNRFGQQPVYSWWTRKKSYSVCRSCFDKLSTNGISIGYPALRGIHPEPWACRTVEGWCWLFTSSSILDFRKRWWGKKGSSSIWCVWFIWYFVNSVYFMELWFYLQ
jgi:hypothetical protein